MGVESTVACSGWSKGRYIKSTTTKANDNDVVYSANDNDLYFEESYEAVAYAAAA